MTMQVIAISSLAAMMMDVRARPSRAIRARASIVLQVDRQQLKLCVPTDVPLRLLDECLKGTLSYCFLVLTREHVWLREAAFKARRMGGIRCMCETPQKEMKRSTSEGDMKHNALLETIRVLYNKLCVH